MEVITERKSNSPSSENYTNNNESTTNLDDSEKVTENNNQDTDFINKNFINKFLDELIISDNYLLNKMNIIGKKLKTIENSRIAIKKLLNRFKVVSKNDKNCEIDFFKQIIIEIENYMISQEEYSLLNQKIIDKFVINGKLLKNKIVNIFMHMDERILNLKNEKEDLNQKFTQKIDANTSNNQKKYILTLEKEIFNLQKIIQHKEKVIKNQKFEKNLKNQFVQLNTLRHMTENIELTKILKNIKNEIKTKDEELQKMREKLYPSFFNQNQSGVGDIQTIREMGNSSFFNQNQSVVDEFKSILKTSNLSIPIDIYQYDCSRMSYIDKGKSINKNSTGYKKQVVYQNQLITKKNKEIVRLKEKIIDSNDTILALDIELKVYRKMENQNQNYTKNIKNMINLHEDKKKYCEKEILDAKKKIQILEEEVKEIIEYIKINYVENSNKLKCFNYIVRKFIRSTEEVKKDLKNFLTDFKTSLKGTNYKNEKTNRLIEKFRDLQLINNTLKKRYLPAIKENVIDKERTKKIKKKTKKQKLPEIKNNLDFSDLQLNLAKRMEELKNVLEEKSQTMNKIEDAIEEIKIIRVLMSEDIKSRNELKSEISIQQTKIIDLEDEIEKTNKQVVEYEIKIELMKKDNNTKQEDITKLETELIKKKTGIKTLLKSKKSYQKVILEKENLIVKKNKKINKLVNKLEKVNKNNIELKTNFENQFNKIQEICEDSFEKYKLLEDLMKKEKIFNQLYKLQVDKINIREKKIYDLQTKFEEQQKLIEHIMTKKLKKAKEKDEDKFSFINLPNEMKKNFQLNKSLSKKIKSLEEINEKLKKISENWEKKYNKLLNRFDKLRVKKNEISENDAKENMETIDSLKRTIIQYEKAYDILKNKKNSESESENFEKFLDNLSNKNENSVVIEKLLGNTNNAEEVYNKSVFSKLKQKMNTKKNTYKRNEILINDTMNKFESKIDALKSKILFMNELLKKNKIFFDLIKDEFGTDVCNLRIDEIDKNLITSFFKHHEDSLLEKKDLKKIENSNKNTEQNLNTLLNLFIDSEIIQTDDNIEIKMDKIKTFLKKYQSLNEDLKKKKMVILELRSQVNEAWDEIKEKEEKISELEEQNFNMLQLHEQNENENSLEKKHMKKDLENLKELVTELKTKSGQNKLVKELAEKIETQEKLNMELKNEIQKKIITINSLQKSLTKNRVNQNNVNGISKNKQNSKYFSFNDNSDLSYSEMSSLVQMKKHNGLVIDNEAESNDSSSLFLKNKNPNNNFKTEIRKDNKLNGISEEEEEIELSENNSFEMEEKKKYLNQISLEANKKKDILKNEVQEEPILKKSNKMFSFKI